MPRRTDLESIAIAGSLIVLGDIPAARRSLILHLTDKSAAPGFVALD